MPELDHSERMSLAAANYRKSELNLNPYPPTSLEIYRLTLEKAFMEGASWYNQIVIERNQKELDELHGQIAALKGGR